MQLVHAGLVVSLDPAPAASDCRPSPRLGVGSAMTATWVLTLIAVVLYGFMIRDISEEVRGE